MKKSLTIPPGTSDLYGDQLARRDYILSVLRGVYEKFGFEPLQTPTFEHESVFDGHHGEGERIQFRFSDLGKTPLVLRYDLTVPMARFLAMHTEILRPFRRFQIAPAYRDDIVGNGHHREFIQCDADTVGVIHPTSDAEVVIMAIQGLTELGFSKFIIRINHRGIIKGLSEYVCKSSRDLNRVPRAIDYVDKYTHLGVAGIMPELMKRGLSKLEARKLATTLSFKGTVAQTFEYLDRLFPVNSAARMAVCELRAIYSYIPKEVQGHVRVDLSLARGADYYTGFILEGIIPGAAVGAVLGGGRYDKLMQKFGGKEEPAVGMAFGIERLMTASEKLTTCNHTACTSVLIYPHDDEATQEAFRIANTLRKHGEKVNFCAQPMASLNAIEYATNKHHTVIVACMVNGKHQVICSGHNSGRLERRFRRLLHSICS